MCILTLFVLSFVPVRSVLTDLPLNQLHPDTLLLSRIPVKSVLIDLQVDNVHPALHVHDVSSSAP